MLQSCGPALKKRQQTPRLAWAEAHLYPNPSTSPILWPKIHTTLSSRSRKKDHGKTKECSWRTKSVSPGVMGLWGQQVSWRHLGEGRLWDTSRISGASLKAEVGQEAPWHQLLVTWGQEEGSQGGKRRWGRNRQGDISGSAKGLCPEGRGSGSHCSQPLAATGEYGPHRPDFFIFGEGRNQPAFLYVSK